MHHYRILLVLFVLFSFLASQVKAQHFLTDIMDTTSAIGKEIYPLYQKYDKLKFGGYMQPQFQMAQTEGVKGYAGGNFAENSNSRFMLRRGRIRIDYGHYNKDGKPLALFAFQFNGTEKGVNIRDFWGKFYENKWEMFTVSAGLFARPMGYEINLSSSDRESPERGRMSQILMKTERDLGMMLSWQPRKKDHPLKDVKIDIGVFNGQGLAGFTDYDSHKDVIGRIAIKPQKINKQNWILSAGISGYYGGITSRMASLYRVSGSGENAKMYLDSNSKNIGYVTPRKYMGADVQFKIPNRKGYTAFRAEYIRGWQTATAASSETQGAYPMMGTTFLPLYIRNFDGAYLYYLQHLGTDKLQFVLKYDWYDPNKKVKNKEVNSTNGFTAADIKYSTLGTGFVYAMNVHVKATAYYEFIQNEATAIAGFEQDVPDNVFTLRLQYRF
jgi:hypothetical protein